MVDGATTLILTPLKTTDCSHSLVSRVEVREGPETLDSIFAGWRKYSGSEVAEKE
jgi:hypothetical protein